MGPLEFPIVNLKDISRTVYPNNAPEVEYKQNDKIRCCFGILASAFAAIGDFYTEEAVSRSIKESLQFFSSRKQGCTEFVRDLML